MRKLSVAHMQGCSCVIVLGITLMTVAVEAENAIPTDCKPQLLVLIVSDVRQEAKRDVIRQSWQAWTKKFEEKFGRDVSATVKYYFVVGRLKKSIPASCTAEAREHNDTVMTETNDYDYEVYTSKVLFGLKWALEHCQFDIVLKVTDLDFVNFHQLVERWLPRVKSNRDLYTGFLVNSAIPSRDEDSAWFISAEHYPKDVYPAYTDRAYALSRSMAERVEQSMTGDIEKVYYDDVAIAIALEKQKVIPSSDDAFTRGVKGLGKCSASVLLDVGPQEMDAHSKAMLQSADGKIC